MIAEGKPTVAFFWSKLGWCPVCTRKAFLWAAYLWAATLIAWASFADGVIFGIAIVVAATATTLWLAHLIAYAARAVAIRHHTGQAEASTRISGRRVLLIFFAAAAASAIPGLASAEQCGGKSGCSSKSCQNKNDRCIQGTRGCQCVKKE